MHPPRSTNELLEINSETELFIGFSLLLKMFDHYCYGQIWDMFSFLSEPDLFTLLDSFLLNLRLFGRDSSNSTLPAPLIV